jgi:hypothetical protein
MLQNLIKNIKTSSRTGPDSSIFKNYSTVLQTQVFGIVAVLYMQKHASIMANFKHLGRIRIFICFDNIKNL